MAETQRDIARSKFASKAGWDSATMESLPGDASFRHYFRLRDGARQALLMDAPPATEDSCAFVTIARHLTSLGLSAPQIEAADLEMGFAIIEDFGTDTYTKLLAAGEGAQPLYELAVDTLIHLHNQPEAVEIDLPPYDDATLLAEVTLFTDWYMPELTGKPVAASVKRSFARAWEMAIEEMPSYTPVLVLRDFHVDNLMALPERRGFAQCALLDFQDALMGHPAYDLVSLLEDARRDVTDDLANSMRQKYREKCLDETSQDFDDWYHFLGAQRHTRVAGVFVRLFVRDGKADYLVHIPRVMRLLTRNLGHPCLAPIKQWFDQHLPDVASQIPVFIPKQVER